MRHYRLAAAYPETFYGQLALARIDATPALHLNDTPVEAAGGGRDGSRSPDAARSRCWPIWARQASLRAVRRPRWRRPIPRPRHLKRLMMLLNGLGLSGDRGAAGQDRQLCRRTHLPDFTHPVIALPPYPGPGAAPEPALVLGLIRQETEFDPYAISSAGARGLMQMMPASAKIAAKQADLPYRPEALLSDTDLQHAAGHDRISRPSGPLWRLLGAGGGGLQCRAQQCEEMAGGQWRSARPADPIDWIEQIPFGETRNYVQRVLENTEVYRARLAGKDVPLQILAGSVCAGNAPTRRWLSASLSDRQSKTN